MIHYPLYEIAFSTSSTISYTLRPLPFPLMVSLKVFSHQGHAVTIASAPVDPASSILSRAVHWANPGLDSVTPPPAPQHQAYSLILVISVSFIPGMLLRTSRGGS